MGKEKTKNSSPKTSVSRSRKEIKRPVFLENANETNKAQYSIEIAKSMNECLWIGDSEHKTIYINPVYERLSGYSLAEAIGKPADFCFDKKSKQIIKEHHNRRKEGIGTQYEATMISKSGKKIPLLVSGAPTESGGTIGIFTNLSQQKSLKEKEEYLSSIIKNSSEAIVILNINRKIQLWNKGAEQLFGHKESEVLNKSIDLIIPPEERQINMQLLEEVEEKHFLKGFEARRVDKSGKFLDIDLSVTKVMGSSKFLGYLIRYHDISEQKRHNNELQKRFEAIQDAYKELGFQKRQIDYIYEIAASAVSKTSLAQLEKLIISSISLLTVCDGVVMRTYDKTTDSLILKNCLGVSQNWWDKSKINYQNSIAQKAIENGRPTIIDNVDSVSYHQGIKLLKSHEFTTMVMIPIFTAEKIIGSLSLYSKDPGKFRLIETDFLLKFAQQCSLALSTKL